GGNWRFTAGALAAAHKDRAANHHDKGIEGHALEHRQSFPEKAVRTGCENLDRRIPNHSRPSKEG
ncbi:MAG TPA: hypothetical protein VGZ25_17315, partial [Gemmataceae bacterium]|nr:hypothetical protein [Gemmataceae bacterium]